MHGLVTVQQLEQATHSSSPGFVIWLLSIGSPCYKPKQVGHSLKDVRALGLGRGLVYFNPYTNWREPSCELSDRTVKDANDRKGLRCCFANPFPHHQQKFSSLTPLGA